MSKVKSETIEIRIGNNSIKPSNTVRNLGVVYDSNLSFKNHITYLSQSVRFQIRNLGFNRKYLTKSAAEQLIHALISSRLDFCNSLFCNPPQKEMIRMQRLQNCAARPPGGGGALPYWRWRGRAAGQGMILRSSILAQGILRPSCGHQYWHRVSKSA